MFADRSNFLLSLESADRISNERCLVISGSNREQSNFLLKFQFCYQGCAKILNSSGNPTCRKFNRPRKGTEKLGQQAVRMHQVFISIVARGKLQLLPSYFRAFITRNNRTESRTDRAARKSCYRRLNFLLVTIIRAQRVRDCLRLTATLYST